MVTWRCRKSRSVVICETKRTTHVSVARLLKPYREDAYRFPDHLRILFEVLQPCDDILVLCGPHALVTPLTRVVAAAAAHTATVLTGIAGA